MALLATQTAVQAGLTPSYSAVSSSDTAVPGDNVVLIVRNAGGSADTVTIVTPSTFSGLAIADQTVTVPATTGERIIPLPASLYADPTTGLATIQHSFTTSVTCIVLGV